MDLNFPLISKNTQNSSRTNLISSIATTQQKANDYSKSLSLLDGNMNKESALNMLSSYDLKKNRDEILRQYYQSDEMSFDDYSAKLDICKLLHKQNPLFSVDYYYKNFDKFMEDALGFKASPSSYLEGIKNSFAAGSTNLMNGIKVAGLLMDGLLNGTDGIEFNQKKEKLMSEIDSSRANYRHDLAMEKYDNIFGKMCLETAMQAPQIAVQALTAFLTGGVLGLGAKATRLTSSIPMYLSQIGGVAESALEMGFDMDTTLALSFAVGTVNQALEYIGDSPVMNNFVSFVKKTNKKTASELAKTSWKTVFGTVGNDIVKAIGTEVPTELGQTATEMFGLNLALAYEQKYKKKFEDLIGYTKEDFAKSLKDTAWSTVLSTPLIAACPSVLENLGSLYGGEWAKTRNAGQFTKYEEGVSILDTGSILTPEYKSKIVSASVLKENPVAPIKYATIGNVKVAIDASDAQISAIKSSKFVYGKEVDISIPTVRGEDSISTSSEIDMGISLESALKIVRDAHKVNLLDGYSLLDADKKITKNEANAIYIAVARTGVETPAVVTLGEGKNTAKFAQDVFGTTFGNYKSEANIASASDQDLDVDDVFDSASEMQDDVDEVDDADEQTDEEESVAPNNSNEQKDSDSPVVDTKERNQPANASSSNNSTNTEATVTEQANQAQSSEAKQDVRKQELTDAVVLEKAESDAYDEIDSIASSSSSSQDSDIQQTTTDTTSQADTVDSVSADAENVTSAPVDNTAIVNATEPADTTINQTNTTPAPADATSSNVDANAVPTQTDASNQQTSDQLPTPADATQTVDNTPAASIQPKPSIFTSTIYAKKEEREAYNELKKQIKTNISNLNASNKYKIALDVNDIELLSDASALTLKAFATAANSSIANVVSTNEGLLEITNYFANASMPNSGKDSDFVDILSFSKQMAKLFYNNVSENTKAYKDIESVYGAFNRADENINKNMAETFAKDFNKWIASRNYGKANNSVLDIFKKLYESLRSVWNFLTGYKITKEKKALFESFFTDQNSVDLTLAKTARKLANKKTSDKTANAVIKNAQNNAKDVNGSSNAILSDPNSVAKAVGKSINKKEKQDKNAVTILSKGEAYQRKVDDYKKDVNKYNASTNYKDYEKALNTKDWVKSFYENLSENEKKTLPSPDDVFIETPLELKESNTINAKPITASVSVQNSSTPTQSSSSQSSSDSVSINTASSTESNTATKKDKAETKKTKTKSSTPKTAASKTTEYKGYSLISATEEAINKAKEVIDAYEKTRDEKISIIEKLTENIDNYQVADSKKKFIDSFKKTGELSKALMIIPEKEITFLKQVNKHIEKQPTSKKIKNKDTGEETVIRIQVKDIIDDDKIVNEYIKVYQNSVDFNKDPSYDNFVKFMNSLMEYGTYTKLIAENPDGYLDEFTSVQEENSGAEIGENSEITKKNKWSVKPSNLIGDYSVNNSINTTFDDYKEKSKKYLQERFNAILKRRGNDRLTKLDNLMFQDGYLFKDIVDLSDANWEAIYDTKRGRVNEKDGKYTFDRNSLSEEIYNASNGNIDRRSSRLAASFLCMLPKSTQDAFIRKNNGNLILSAREAGLDIEGKVRAGSLLNSCKIILTPESDITSVIHEAFHLMVTYDTESRDNIYNSIKETVLSKGEDYEKLKSFVEKNIPIFTKRSFEMAMEDFELFSKDSLTVAEQIRLDEAVASLFEAWMRNEQKNTTLLGKIGQLFKAIADKFREIYRYATGGEFLPESIDLSFKSLFNEKDSKIYHYNGLDIAEGVDGLTMDILMTMLGWHGSAYEFKEFLLEKINTGEGAQTFGWGLYFSQLKEIAKEYAKRITNKNNNLHRDSFDLTTFIENKFDYNLFKVEFPDGPYIDWDTTMFTYTQETGLSVFDEQNPESAKIINDSYKKNKAFKDFIDFTMVGENFSTPAYFIREFSIYNVPDDIFNNLLPAIKEKYGDKSDLISHDRRANKTLSAVLNSIGIKGNTVDINSTRGGDAKHRKNIIIYNDKDISVVEHWKGYENVFRAQQSLDALAKVSIEDAANMASRFIEDHMDGALNMHDKYIHWLKSMKHEASMDRLVEYLSSNNEINRFIGRYNSEELKLEIVKNLAEWFINIPTSPSAVAKNISGMAKKLQKNIDDGNFKLITSDEDVSKLSSKDKKRVESAKESYKILSDYLSDIYKNARSKVSNMIAVAADYAVFVGVNNSEAKTAFDNFIGNISKGTAKVDLSPEELLSIVDGLVTKEGKLILEQRDNVAWNPLIDMLAIASSYDDKFTASMRNNINHADPDYIDLANKILKIEQGVYYDREEESRDHTRVALAELALNYSDEDWISIVTDKTIEGDGTSNLLSSLLEVISNLNKKADELLVKKNKSLKTVIELNDVYNNLFNLSTDEELRIKALKDALEKAKKENDKSLEESKEIRAAAKRLNSAFEKLVNVIEGDKGIILKDKENIDSIVKEIMKAFSAKERQLQKAIDRNKAEADKYANSDAYRTAKEIIELRNSILHKITRLTKNNDARVSGSLQKFFNIISSKDKKKDIKPIPKTIFKDVPSYIKPALSSALKSLMDAGVIVQLKDYPKANEFIMKKGTLEDGTVIYDENTWILVKSLEEFTGSQDDRDVLSGIAEAFDKVKEQSKKFVEQAEKASKDALEEKRNLITESILSTKEIGLTSDEVNTWFEEEYHNQSSDEKNMNRQKAMHIFKSEFLTVSEQIKRFNPALYAYMYGGLMGNVYNESNLNTIIDKEIKNKTERTIAFNNKVSELFGVKASNVKYRFDKLFSNTKYNISAMSYEEFETNIGTNLGDLRYRDISLRTNDIDPRLSALAMKKNNVEVALKKLKDSKARLDKKLSKLMPGTIEYNKIYTQLNLIDLKIERNENILHGDVSKLKKIPSKYTIQELMGIYIYAQQEDGIRRLTGESITSIPNNIGIENIIWVMNEMLNNKELEKYRELADYIVEEVGSRYSEMAEVYARAHNFKKTLSIVDMYFPLATPEETDSKMLSESPLSMDIAMFASYGSYGVSKSMTKERTNTKMALSLDVIDSYISAINRQEHYIAFKQKYDEMKNLFKDGTDITKAIRYVLKDKQGEAQRLINLLDKYVDNIASNSHDMDIIDRIMSWVRKNFVASKLAWNFASMIQQLPTYLLVARKIGIFNALKSLAYIAPSVNHEFSPILQRSTQILYKQRPETADYGGTKSVNKSALYEWFKSHVNENATMFTYEAFNKFVDSGLAAIEFIDKKVTNAMYYALYNHNFEEMLKNKEYKEIFDSDVTKYEDVVIQVTQQELLDMISSSNAKDNPLAYSSHNSLLKQLLLFTPQTTKQFNMLWGSIADIKDISDTDAIIGAFETFLTVGAVSMLSVLITGYPLPDDDGEDWSDFWAKLGIGTLFELVGTVPLLGSIIRDLAYGNNYAETNFIVEIGNLYKQLTDEEKGDCSIAFANTAAEILGFVGFPSTTAMKVFRAVTAYSEDASYSDVFYLLNTRFGKGMNIIGE